MVRLMVGLAVAMLGAAPVWAGELDGDFVGPRARRRKFRKRPSPRLCHRSLNKWMRRPPWRRAASSMRIPPRKPIEEAVGAAVVGVEAGAVGAAVGAVGGAAGVAAGTAAGMAIAAGAGVEVGVAGAGVGPITPAPGDGVGAGLIMPACGGLMSAITVMGLLTTIRIPIVGSPDLQLLNRRPQRQQRKDDRSRPFSLLSLWSPVFPF